MRPSIHRYALLMSSLVWLVSTPAMAMGDRQSPDSPQNSTECIVGGCSGQLCTDAANGDMMTTCEYRAEYACYKGAECKRQTDGNCGWTITPAMKQCLANPPAIGGATAY